MRKKSKNSEFKTDVRNEFVEKRLIKRALLGKKSPFSCRMSSTDSGYSVFLTIYTLKMQKNGSCKANSSNIG